MAASAAGGRPCHPGRPARRTHGRPHSLPRPPEGRAPTAGPSSPAGPACAPSGQGAPAMGSCPQNPGWKQAWPPRARRVGCRVLGWPQRSSRNRLAELLGRGGWSGWGGVPVDSLTGLTQYVPRGGAQAPLTPQPRDPPAIWRLRCGCRTPAGLTLLRRAAGGAAAAPSLLLVPAGLEGAPPGSPRRTAVHMARGPPPFLRPARPAQTALTLPTEPCS